MESQGSQSHTSAFFDPDVSKCSDASSVFHVSLDEDSCKGPEDSAANQQHASKDIVHQERSQQGHTHFQVC